LTRFQHILLRLGEWIAYAESAGCLARRAARHAEGKQHDKANQRFDPAALAAISRIFAREAAMKIATETVRWISDESSPTLSAIYRAQAGLLSDMDLVADVLYSRAEKRAGAAA
jgi:alkylation response protein AidB-like acyl-CoA dehydrogenase